MPILFSDGFEDPAVSESAWDQSSDPILNIVTDPAKAHSGSRVNELVYTPGWNGPGFMNRFFSPVPEVYVRWYEKYSPGWIWSTVATKGVFVLTNSGDPLDGIVTGVGFDDPIYSVDLNRVPRLNSGFPMPTGEWVCFELHWHANTGVFQLWINDTLRIDTNGGTLPPSVGINRFTLSAYYNSSPEQPVSCSGQIPCGVPQLQYRWVDDIIISTERIGCAAGPPPPPPPPPTGTLALNKSSYTPGEPIVVTVGNASGNDWVGKYALGAPIFNAELEWYYVGSNTTLSFTAPQALGQYEMRLILNDCYSNSCPVEATAAFSVTSGATVTLQTVSSLAVTVQQ